MSVADTLLGGGLALAGGVVGSYLTHHWQRSERVDDQRRGDLRALQDAVTDVQEVFVVLAAQKVAGTGADKDVVVRSTRFRQEVWKNVARIDSEELWDLALKLIRETVKVTHGATKEEVDAAMSEIGDIGADIQRQVGKLLGGKARQLDGPVQAV